MTLTLESIDRCMHRILPGVIATTDRDGMPNVNYVSQLVVVDSKHLALSYQFATKTRQNLEVNPRATLEVYDPLTLDAYRLQLKFLRAETSGTAFDLLSCRIEAMASHLGLADIFKLRAAYICEVLGIEARTGFIAAAASAHAISPAAAAQDALSDVRALQLVSDRLNRATDLESLLEHALGALDEAFGFTHGMILVPENDEKLVAVASHGYGDEGIGAEVVLGEGLIGVVAKTRRLLRIVGIDTLLEYGRELRVAVGRQQAVRARLAQEIPLPGLHDARSQMAIPLLVQDRLLGVLALESRESVAFDRWHEAFLQVLANQIASGMDRLAEPAEAPSTPTPAPAPVATPKPTGVRRELTYYRNDDCVFVDDEYLIRNVPGKILWKLLKEYQADGRTEFSNRELRLDPNLGLPPIRDNLESRLVLLRKRLEQKCPDLRLVSTKRGKFALVVACELVLHERESA